MRIQWPNFLKGSYSHSLFLHPLFAPYNMFYWHKRLLVKYLLREQMLCCLKHLMLVWWHKGEPNSQPLTHYTLALKMHVLIHCMEGRSMYSIPVGQDSLSWGLVPQDALSHTQIAFPISTRDILPDESHQVPKADPGVSLNSDEGSGSDLPGQGSQVHWEQHSLVPTFSFSPPLLPFSSLVCSASTARFPQQWFSFAR